MAEERDNIAKFNDVSAELFARAYASFPQPLTVDCYKWIGEQAPTHTTEPEGEPAFVRDTIRWLVKNRYLDNLRRDGRGTYGYTLLLTPKSLAFLGQPAALLPSQSNGAALIEATKSGAGDSMKEARRTIVGELVKLGLGALTG